MMDKRITEQRKPSKLKDILPKKTLKKLGLTGNETWWISDYKMNITGESGIEIIEMPLEIVKGD